MLQMTEFSAFFFLRIKSVYFEFKIHFKWPSCIFFLAVAKNAAMNIECGYLLRIVFSVPLCLCLIVGSLGYVIILF